MALIQWRRCYCLPERRPLWYSNPLKSTVNQTSDTLFDNWIFRDAGLLILSWMSRFISLVVHWTLLLDFDNICTELCRIFTYSSKLSLCLSDSMLKFRRCDEVSLFSYLKTVIVKMQNGNFEALDVRLSPCILHSHACVFCICYKVLRFLLFTALGLLQKSGREHCISTR